MRKRRLPALLGSICLILVLAALPFMAACAQPAPAPTPTPAPAPAPAPAPPPPPAPKPVSAADFYRDNTPTLIVPNPAGGGNDYLARLLASYWTEVSGGTMKVKNKVGGGGIVGTNFVYTAEPDGLTLGVMHTPTLISAWLYKEPGVEFDLAKFNWIVSVVKEPVALVVSTKAPYESIDDLKRAKDLKFGTSLAKGSSPLAEAIVSEVFGLDSRIITGYEGGPGVGLALARGEFDAVAWSLTTSLEWVDKGWARPVLAVIDFERADAAPDVPAIVELAELSPDQEAMLRVASTLNAQKSIYTMPGVPEDRVQFLLEAFNQIMAIEGFLKQAKLKWPVWTKPVSGEDMAAFIETTTIISQEDLAKAEELMEKYEK